jgi:hypothetical protein
VVNYGANLFDELHREEVSESFRADRLVRAGVEGGRGGLRQIGNDVVPESV